MGRKAKKLDTNRFHRDTTAGGRIQGSNEAPFGRIIKNANIGCTAQCGNGVLKRKD